MRPIFDGHCHLDSQGGADCAAALATLRAEATACGVSGILLLNIPGPQFGGVVGYENEEVLEKAKTHAGFFRVFPCVNPLAPDVARLVETYKNRGAAGIKLHPRLHKFKVDCDECTALVAEAGRLGMPVLACGFPDGLNITLGNTPKAFGHLAMKCPGTRIAIGHACGHLIIDALMVAKAFDNVHLDLSFTPLYYRGSTVVNDIAYVLHSIKGRKVFWGTDFPDRPYGQTVQMSTEVFSGMNLEEELLTMVFATNIHDFLEANHG